MGTTASKENPRGLEPSYCIIASCSCCFRSYFHRPFHPIISCTKNLNTGSALQISPRGLQKSCIASSCGQFYRPADNKSALENTKCNWVSFFFQHGTPTRRRKEPLQHTRNYRNITSKKLRFR